MTVTVLGAFCLIVISVACGTPAPRLSTGPSFKVRALFRCASRAGGNPYPRGPRSRFVDWLHLGNRLLDQARGSFTAFHNRNGSDDMVFLVWRDIATARRLEPLISRRVDRLSGTNSLDQLGNVIIVQRFDLPPGAERRLNACLLATRSTP